MSEVKYDDIQYACKVVKFLTDVLDGTKSIGVILEGYEEISKGQLSIIGDTVHLSGVWQNPLVLSLKLPKDQWDLVRQYRDMLKAQIKSESSKIDISV